MMQKLRDAMQTRDVTLLRELLEHKPQLSSPECGELLWIVIEDADTEIATMLVKAGTNVNITNKKHHMRPYPLHALAKKADDPKKLALMYLLLDHGAKINYRDKSGRTILDYIVMKLSEPFDVFKELWNRGVAVCPSVLSVLAAKPNYVDYLSLFVRISNKVKLLIEYGVDIHLNAQRGDSLICMALRYDEPPMAEVLIRNGANIHSRIHNPRLIPRRSRECYPIHTACEYGKEKNIQRLWRAGVNVNVFDGNGETPFSAILQHGTLSNAHCTMIKHLVLMLARGSSRLNNDLAIIHQHQHMIMFYENCSTELIKMKASIRVTSFSCFSFFTEDIRKVTLLIKNQKFLDSLSECQIKVSFPLYCSDVEWIIENAVKRKANLALKDEAFYEKVGRFLPSLVIEKIMNYLCLIDD